jgi:hypothetical protein
LVLVFNDIAMNIRNIQTIIVLTGLLVVTSTGCNKFLDVPPQGRLTAEQFWKNRDQAIAAIAGIYANLGSTSWDFTQGGNLNEKDISPVEAYIYWGDLRGELLASAAGKLSASQINKENIDNFLVAPNDVTTKYTDFYRIINEANLAIKNIPDISALDPSLTKTEADQLVGEAYFLRSYAYFWLLRTFKEVPMILNPSEKDDQQYNIAKSTSEEITIQIIDDLTLAKNMLPDWYSNAQYPRCRATRYTAATVLADVYLWKAATGSGNANDSYDKAISNCDEVISSGRYFLLPGTGYGSIFLAGNSSESIFETYGNYLINNQTNNLKGWFDNYFLIPDITDALFSSGAYADYRGYLPPSGPTAPKGSIVSYNPTTRLVLKYNITTNDAHWIFYRYPDVLMMKAEALVHRFVDDENQLKVASALVNQVRERAYGNPMYEQVDATSTAEMDNILLDERGREFIAEGKRWFDLVRFASRDNFAHKEYLIQRVLSSFPAVSQLVIAPRLANPESWYLPLNADALNSNLKLIQNPYYQ